MAGHTMTIIKTTKLWIVGGFSSTYYYNEVDYEFDANTLEWSELGINGVKPTGGRTLMVFLFAFCIYV